MKRTFPYASAVPEVELKRRDLGARAGTEAAQPRIYSSSLPMQYEQPVRLHMQQDFAHDSCPELRGLLSGYSIVPHLSRTYFPTGSQDSF